MKKVFTVVIALALFVIVSCGKKDATTTTVEETTVTTVAITAETNIVEEVPVNTQQMAETAAGQEVGLE